MTPPTGIVVTGRHFRLAILESPYAGDVDANVAYARQCVRHCLERGDSPIASHLLFTQPGILDDGVPAERELGIDAGLAWGRAADVTVVYVDRGISRGMKEGIRRACREGRPVEFYLVGEKGPVSVDPELYEVAS